jgi:hypothetical protein
MSEKLTKALEKAGLNSDLTIGHLVILTGSDALLIVSLFSILPFLQPIPVPGVSTVLGLVIFLQGFALVLRGEPILTERMRQIKISSETFRMIRTAFERVSWVTSKISNFKHPMARSMPVRALCGMAIMTSAAFLSLPLPIPFSNFIPALAIFMICAGLLEEDLMLILLGQGINLVILWISALSAQMIREVFQNYF